MSRSSAVPVRLGLFVALLVLCAAGAWGAGLALRPPPAPASSSVTSPGSFLHDLPSEHG
jgi:hypothetical protein